MQGSRNVYFMSGSPPARGQGLDARPHLDGGRLCAGMTGKTPRPLIEIKEIVFDKIKFYLILSVYFFHIIATSNSAKRCLADYSSANSS